MPEGGQCYDSAHPMSSRPSGSPLLRVVFLALPSLALLPAIPTERFGWVRGPAPYPPEWQWGLRANALAGPRWPAILMGAALLGLIVLAGHLHARFAVAGAAAVLTGATILGLAFQMALVGLRPEGPWRALLVRAASRTITSFHTIAVSEEARDPRGFLEGYPERLDAFRTRAPHAATHPPGGVLFYRGALAVCERWPSLTRFLLRRAELEGRPLGHRLTPEARAAALLGALVLGLLGAATVWPAAWLAETVGLRPAAALAVGVLYALLPGPALMVPEFDQALALPLTAAAALLASAIATGRGPWAKGILAGLLVALAVFVSYGAAFFAGLGGLAALSLASTRDERRRGAAILGLAAGTAVLLTLSLRILGYDALASARVALAIHRDVYTMPRSYALWLPFNLVDLAVFLGPSLALLGLLRLGPAIPRPGSAGAPALRFVLAVAVGLVFLTASGVTRGEVGRLWIPLMPLILVAAMAGGPTDGALNPRPAYDGALALTLGVLGAAISISIGSWWEL